ncbi:hypothetical protein AGDE_13675 [Angomonas deanei]|nr:hypothetical protein AGDE_13675 [Angomonas deanei]|eukprot:EPY21963.1 hypothetical protein AGDE_13675 [Angomonas deanei]
MTAYNYGVLLEAVLRQPARALQLYERAAALGDLVASTRARQLRQMLAEGENGEEEEDDDDSEEEGEEEESQASSQGL